MRGIAGYFNDDVPVGASITGPVEDPAMHDEMQVLQLRMKRKHQLGLIRKMLEESGYDDLAKMTTLSRRDFDEDI